MAKKRTLSPTERAYSAQVKRIKNFIRRAEKRGYIFNENTLPTKPKNIRPESVRKLQRLTPERLYKKAKYISQLSEEKLVSAKKGLQLELKARIEKAKETRERNKQVKKAKQYDENIRSIVAEELKYRQDKQDWKKNKNYEPEEPEIVELAAGNDVDPETGEILPPENNGWSNEEIKMFDTIQVPEREISDTSFFSRTVIDNFYKRLEKYTNSDATEIMKNWINSCIANTSENDVANMLQRGAEAGLVINGAVMYNSTYLYSYLTGMMEYLDLPKGFKDDIIDSVEIDDDYGLY